MSENHDILVLEFIRRLGAKVEGLESALRDLRHRVARLEHELAALTATEAMHHAMISVRLDRLEAQVALLDDDDPDALDRPAGA